MLVKHGILYFFARGLPGIINLAALMIFTRMLTPHAYGEYALAISAIVLGHSVLYQWLQLGLMRFYLSFAEQEKEFLITVLGAYGLVSIFIGCGITLYALFFNIPWHPELTVITVNLLWFYAFHELNLQLSTIKSKPRDYAFYGLVKSIMALAFGVLFIYHGFMATGALLGMLSGLFLANIIGFYRGWYFPLVSSFNKKIFVELFRYGLPLTATFALSYVISSSDRFLLGWLIDFDVVGMYAAGYDIASYTLIVLMVIIHTAAYPLALRALEHEGEAQAKKQLRTNFTLLWSIALPSTVGVILLAEPIADILVGAEFRAAAVQLIPWVSLAVILNGLRAFYFDISFQFGKKTTMQIWGVLLAVILNLILNLLWIPEFGYLGAAYASVVAYFTALIVSAVLGRKIFSLSIPWLDSFKITCAVLIMALSILLLPKMNNPLWLIISIATGAVIYFMMVLLLNVAGSRLYMADVWKNLLQLRSV